MRHHLAVIALTSLALAVGTAAAQTLPNPIPAQNSVGATYDNFDVVSPPGADSATVHVAETDIFGAVMGPGMAPNGATPLFESERLGFDATYIWPNTAAGPIVNAFSTGFDVYDEATLVYTGAPPAFDLTLEFTVGREPGDDFETPSFGTDPVNDPNGTRTLNAGWEKIRDEYEGNGAASDTFLMRYIYGSFEEIDQGSDHLLVNAATYPYSVLGYPDPFETNLNSLTGGRRFAYPAFFSVDVYTAADLTANLGQVIRACDVLMVDDTGGGPVITVWFDGMAHGLHPTDDIDALLVNVEQQEGGRQIFAFSIARSSDSITNPGAVHYPITSQLGAGGLYLFDSLNVGNELSAYAFPEVFGITGPDPSNPNNGGELNGVWAYDPPLSGAGNVGGGGDGGANESPPLGEELLPEQQDQLAVFFMDDSSGGRARAIYANSLPYTRVSVANASPYDDMGGQFIIFGRLGKPWDDPMNGPGGLLFGPELVHGAGAVFSYISPWDPTLFVLCRSVDDPGLYTVIRTGGTVADPVLTRFSGSFATWNPVVRMDFTFQGLATSSTTGITLLTNMIHYIAGWRQ